MKSLLLSLFMLAYITGFSNYILVNKNADGHASIYSANPGDTFAFRSSQNPWTYVYVNGISGSAANKVVFINVGGQVQMSNGFSFENCNYFKLTGTGSSDTYGFRIQNPSGTALTAKGKSAFFSFDHAQVVQSTYAVWVKNEVSDYPCDTTYNYPNHPLHDFEISYIDANTIYQDGFYLGSTAPTGGRSATCNGVTYNNRIAGRLYNVYIHDIIMTQTGRTGIQLSGCDSGTNRIANCTIKNAGFEFNPDQGAGIWLGGMTANCEVDHNNVDSTWKHNYISYGINTCYFHDNVGNHAGMLYGDSSGHTGNHRNAGLSSALINDPPSVPVKKSTFRWEHNTLGTNTDGSGTKIAVLKWTDNYNTNNIICDCGSPIFVTSGITYSTTCTVTGCQSVYDSGVNNTFGTAVQIPFNTPIKGTIGTLGDRDYYKIIVTVPDSLRITLTTLPADYNLYFYDSAHNQLKAAKKTGTANETIATRVNITGTYYIGVLGANGVYDSLNCYTLNVATMQQQGSLMSQAFTAKTAIKMYPNPARSILNMYLDKVSNKPVVKIANSYGQLILTEKITNTQTKLDISKLSNGVYMVSVFDADNHLILNEKFIKQ